MCSKRKKIRLKSKTNSTKKNLRIVLDKKLLHLKLLAQQMTKNLRAINRMTSLMVTKNTSKTQILNKIWNNNLIIKILRKSMTRMRNNKKKLMSNMITTKWKKILMKMK